MLHDDACMIVHRCSLESFAIASRVALLIAAWGCLVFRNFVSMVHRSFLQLGLSSFVLHDGTAMLFGFIVLGSSCGLAHYSFGLIGCVATPCSKVDRSFVRPRSCGDAISRLIAASLCRVHRSFTQLGSVSLVQGGLLRVAAVAC